MQMLTPFLLDRLKRNANRPAISFFRKGRRETECSFQELDQDSARLALLFADRGVSRGDRVLFSLGKSLFFVTAYLAVHRLGAIAVPCNPDFTRSEKAYLVEDAAPKLIISREQDRDVFQAIALRTALIPVDETRPYQELPEIQNSPLPRKSGLEHHPDDPALIIYTSGTTGPPKGAILTQSNLAHDALNVSKIWEIGPEDRLLHALPLFHVHGLCFALTTCLLTGASVAMLDRFQADEVLTFLRSKDPACTLFMGVPTMYTKLLDSLEHGPEAFQHIRLWTSGSAPLKPAEFERIQQMLGKPPVEREGMSETGMNFSNPLHGVKKPGSIGLPLPGLQVRIVDPETGADLQTGQIGEIWLKGPSISPGYWNKPSETAAAFHNGWFKTGDLGKKDGEGYYYLTDRLKHIIISGGENISPKEIENRLNQLESVFESAVFGLPDETLGERVAAAVVPHPGATIQTDELQAYCREHLHKWKCPKQFFIVDHLPRNTMGKVLKHELQRLAGD
ncbi:MAG: AMP-binding protein [Desulfohalobiaceae bacterium]|nr:AMP-binding protein [Desulfohalobiaceae bacterium]